MTADVERLLAESTVAELGASLRRREVSSVDLTRASLDRLERVGPRFNAVASVMADRALAEAKAAERELGRGRDRGPLHGIPYGAKDLLAAAGAPTTWGAEPFRDRVFDRDAVAIQRLKQAGAVLAAKLAMVALAGGGGYRFAGASLQGPGRNPWDPSRWSGGSSSGSGIAIAARLVPFALGSETSGSIVTPSAYCGVTGLRPTYGRVSRRGAMALSWTLDKIGPLARTAEDCGLVLQAMAGRDEGDPSTVGRRWRFAGVPPLDPRGVRIGYAPVDFEVHAADGLRPAFTEALNTLRSMGAELVEAELPSDIPYGAMTTTIIDADGSAAFAHLIDDGRIDQLWDERQKSGFRAGLNIPARDYIEAHRLRAAVRGTFQDLFRRVDVLLAPTRWMNPPLVVEPLDAIRRPPDGDRPGNSALIPAGNLAGLPAVAFPCGFSAEGLPTGLQVVGRPFDEGHLLALVAAYQSRTDWHRRVPPGVA